MNPNQNSPKNQNIDLQKNENKESSYIQGNIFTMNFADDKKITRFFQKNDSDDEEENRDSGISLPYLDKKNENNNQEGFEYNESNKDKNEALNPKSEYDIEEYNNNKTQRKTLFERVLGPVDAGSVRGSIFNLTIFCLGSGCLNIPQKIGQMSLLVAFIDICLSGAATYMTLNLLIKSSKKAKKFNYGEVVEDYFGKIASYILTISCLIYTFGVLILYMVVSNYIIN
jgi:hypothetical protein